MPKLIRFVLINSTIGMLIGWAIAAALFFLDINGLGTMLLNSDSKIALLALIGVMFGSTFAFGYLATAVWMLPTDKDEFDKL